MPSTPPGLVYVRWYENSQGAGTLQYWNKETNQYSNADEVDFESASFQALYRNDPNYAALWADASIDIVNQQGSTGSIFDGIEDLLKPAKKHSISLLLILAAVAVIGFFLYKYFKKK